MSLSERARKDRGFSERYTLGDRLGVGGMGEVYRGLHRALGREVAIKFLVSELLRDTQYRERFIAEARLASKLIHQNVVAVFDFGVADDMPYLVTELVTGRPLSEMLAGGKRLPPADVMSIALQMLDGLGAIHQLGIIHRDFKPENILIASGEPPWVKIADFGIAKQQDGGSGPETNSGIVMGTPAYMAPEQALGDPLSAGTDLYAFTLILYVMVVGHHPIKTGTAYETVRRQVLEVPRIPPEVPRPMAAVLKRGLAKSPAERYATAAELKADLMRVDPASLGRAVSGSLLAVAKPPASGTVPSTQFDAIPEGAKAGTLAMEKPSATLGNTMGADLLEAVREDTFPEPEPVAPTALPPRAPVPTVPSAPPPASSAKPAIRLSSASGSRVSAGSADPAYRASVELTAIRPRRSRGILVPLFTVISITGLLGVGAFFLHSKKPPVAPPSLDTLTELKPVLAKLVAAPGTREPEAFKALDLCMENQLDQIAQGHEHTVPAAQQAPAASPKSVEMLYFPVWDMAWCLTELTHFVPNLDGRLVGAERVDDRYRTVLASVGSGTPALPRGHPWQRLGWMLTLMRDPESDELVSALQGLMAFILQGNPALDRNIALSVTTVTLSACGYLEAGPIPQVDPEAPLAPPELAHLKELFAKLNTEGGMVMFSRFNEGRHKLKDIQQMLLVAQVIHELEARVGESRTVSAAKPSISLARLEKVPGFPADLRKRLLEDLGPGASLDLATARKLSPARLHELAVAAKSPMVDYLVRKIPAS